MRHINFIILFLLIFINISFTTLSAKDDYEPSELPKLVSDFTLCHTLIDEKGNPIQGSVSGVATIRILKEDKSSDGIYTLTLYIDRSYVARKDRISLPYDFKWNFKGLSNGEHEFLFTLKDLYGKIGVLRLNITVQN